MEHSFSQAPTADIPRSSFDRSHGLKTTFNAGELVPIFVDEALPGDTLSINPTLFARINTPLYPLMDNIFLDVHFFSVPNRLLWDNFRKFMGEQTNPDDSTDYTVPRTSSTTWGEQSIGDYFGIPTKQPIQTSSLPFRAYNLIYNEWYRDQNLVDSATVNTGDNLDNASLYPIRKRGKRHDYFTSCLPWLQKGDAVNIPLGNQAPIEWSGSLGNTNVSVIANNVKRDLYESDGANRLRVAPEAGIGQQLYADLSNATASTVNELRRAFQIQKLLERDA
ncbi:phage capsid protein, partial [Planctomycetota bacterium]|nr:phage capsid protein [Planctomycetota bacterium]